MFFAGIAERCIRFHSLSLFACFQAAQIPGRTRYERAPCVRNQGRMFLSLWIRNIVSLKRRNPHSVRGPRPRNQGVEPIIHRLYFRAGLFPCPEQAACRAQAQDSSESDGLFLHKKGECETRERGILSHFCGVCCRCAAASPPELHSTWRQLTSMGSVLYKARVDAFYAIQH